MNTGQSNDESLFSRIEKLEEEVGRLKGLLESVIAGRVPDEDLFKMDEPEVEKQPPRAAAPPPEPVPPVSAKKPAPPTPAPALPAPVQEGPPAPWKTSEYWLGRIGVGLVLFGVVFLFKYAVDQGWLTPAARVAGGVAIGGGLFGWGMAVRGSRRVLSRLLSGGGIAAWYITGYAAFQMYGLVGHTTAFVFLSAVTALALGLGAVAGEPLLSVIGTGGGLSTPFMLYTEGGSVAGLTGYTCLILAGAGAVFLLRGWRSLFWVMAASGWSIFILAGNQAGHGREGVTALDRVSLEMAVVLIGWLGFWLMAVAREVFEGGRRQAPKFSGWYGDALNELYDLADKALVPLAAFVTPLLMLGVSRNIWKLPGEAWGWYTFGVAAVYAAGYAALRRRGYRHLMLLHSFTAAFLLTLAFTQWFSGNLLVAAAAGEAVALYAASRFLKDRPVALFALAQLAILVIAAAARGMEAAQFSSAVLIDWPRAAELAVVGSLGATYFLARTREDRNICSLAASILLTVTLWQWFSGNLQVVVLAIEALALHLVSRRLEERPLEAVAFVVQAVVVLILVSRLVRLDDLSLPAIWNARTAADLLAMLTLAATGFLVKKDSWSRNLGISVKDLYLIVVHILFLGLLLREFSLLPQGQAWVSAVWGAYGMVLLLVGLRSGRAGLRKVGLVTLLLVVGKLFLVDLARIAAIWRIVLFLCFGGLFLVLSQSLRNLWKETGKSPGGK